MYCDPGGLYYVRQIPSGPSCGTLLPVALGGAFGGSGYSIGRDTEPCGGLMHVPGSPGRVQEELFSFQLHAGSCRLLEHSLGNSSTQSYRQQSYSG